MSWRWKTKIPGSRFGSMQIHSSKKAQGMTRSDRNASGNSGEEHVFRNCTSLYPVIPACYMDFWLYWGSPSLAPMVRDDRVCIAASGIRTGDVSESDRVIPGQLLR
jgi:hypothetical protein